MKKLGKRKLNDHKNNIKNKQVYEYVNTIKNNENSNNEQDFQYDRKKNKKQLNDKLLNKNKNENSVIVASKESINLIQQVLPTNNENIDENHAQNNEENNENKKINKDNFLLSSIYDLFEGYDEIIIKPISKNQYIINASIKLEENSEIKFEIIYDNERDYFDYYSNNKNFRFENEDEPFNYDLDIPKEDFTLLIKNFKKFKFKNK
jgi:hypothetical protein